jgi:hypothetical protein
LAFIFTPVANKTTYVPTVFTKYKSKSKKNEKEELKLFKPVVNLAKILLKIFENGEIIFFTFLRKTISCKLQFKIVLYYRNDKFFKIKTNFFNFEIITKSSNLQYFLKVPASYRHLFGKSIFRRVL